ncbi:Esterase FE4 [Gryllus bimaculatus]|nr:Esterase FE4 [Gryllus bimaculatus]
MQKEVLTWRCNSSSQSSGDQKEKTEKPEAMSPFVSYERARHREIGGPKPPQRAEAWEGVRDGTRERSECTQLKFPTRELVGREDCLYLNVYTTRLPVNDSVVGKVIWDVVVLIHGGGFTHGSGHFDDYSPEHLLDEHMVLVTFNYRLGPFGFLATDDEASPGNYGLKDQLDALRWVRRNIERFSGNPQSVSLLGFHAGAASAHLHLLSPLSQEGFAVRHGSDWLHDMHYPFVPVIEPTIKGKKAFIPKDPVEMMKDLKDRKILIPWIMGVAANEGLPQALRVPQGDDIRYLFPDRIGGIKVEYEEAVFPTVDRLVKLVHNFARDGDPTPEEIDLLNNVLWPLAEGRNFEYIDIGDNITIVSDGFYSDRMAFWDSIDKEFNVQPHTKDEL